MNGYRQLKEMIRKTKLLSAQPLVETGLDLEALATFEVSSEDQGHPLENILRNDASTWRASEPGLQTIRVIFDHPQTITRIYLRFDETRTSRTQEFVLSRQAADDKVWTDLRRQQFNFSPPGTTTEIEEYLITLPRTLGLEIVIQPSIGGGETATLTRLSLA